MYLQIHVMCVCISLCMHRWVLSFKREKFFACKNMDSSKGYYVKWNKSDTEKQYCMISLPWKSKKLLESESRMTAPMTGVVRRDAGQKPQLQLGGVRLGGPLRQVYRKSWEPAAVSGPAPCQCSRGAACGPRTWVPVTRVETCMEFLASARPSLSRCRHLGSEPIDAFLSLWHASFQINKCLLKETYFTSCRL